MKNIQWRWLWIIGLFLAACTPTPSETPEGIETQNIALTQTSSGTPIPERKRVLLPLIFRELTPEPIMTSPPAPTGQSTSPFGFDTGLPDFSATLEAELYGPPTQAAKEALARLKGVSVNAIFLVHIESTTWSNTCLEVPASGLPCQNFETPGFLIVLRLDGDLYEYRTDTTAGRVAASP